MSKFLRVDCKITNDDKRCRFSIEDDLANLDAFKGAIAGKMFIHIIEQDDENQDDEPNNDEEELNDNDEDEPNGLNNLNNDDDEEERIQMALGEMVLSYTSRGDSKPIKIKTNDEFKDVIEFHCSSTSGKYFIAF